MLLDRATAKAIAPNLYQEYKRRNSNPLSEGDFWKEIELRAAKMPKEWLEHHFLRFLG